VHFFRLMVAVIVVFNFSLSAIAAPVEEVDEFMWTAKEGAAVQKQKGSWVPVPIPVSNPTIGSGLQFTLMYLHGETDSEIPNRTSGLIGMYTDNESWFVGGFHDGNFSDGKYRILTGAGYGSFNLKYFGVGEDSILRDHPLSYEFKGVAGLLRLQRKVPWGEHWFAGLQYIYLDTETIFDAGSIVPGLPVLRGNITNAGLGPVLSFDSRDDNYYPTHGQYLELVWTSYHDTWGGDLNYRKFNASTSHYQILVPKVVLALHAEFKQGAGEIPFFDMPALNMRGFPAGQYRDLYTFSLHAEGRYKFHPRWGVNLFMESGWYGDESNHLFAGETIVSYGGGIRWQVTEDKKIHLGAELAFSGEDQGFYITVGEKY